MRRALWMMGAVVMSCGATAQQKPKPNGEVDAAPPHAVSVTVYNQGFGLVKEKRRVQLTNGRTPVRVVDVAALILPTSVYFKSLTAPNSVSVREQNYQYDLITPISLLNTSVGKRVVVRQAMPDGKIRIVEGTIIVPVTGTIAAMSDGNVSSFPTYQSLVVKLDDGTIVLNPQGEISLKEMPSGLIPRPQLAWQVDSDRAGLHDVEVGYITNGMTWMADYVAVLNANDTFVDLTGWVTLNNRSGTTYSNAALQLMAGDVRTASMFLGTMGSGGMGGGMGGGREVPFKEQSLFEYHLYTLTGTTTLKNNEQKQMTLLTADKAPTVKSFIYDGAGKIWGRYGPSWRPREDYDTNKDEKVKIVVRLDNSKPALGIPLPQGRVRMYKADAAGGLQFVGEDTIDHTPQGETVKLTVGSAFDIVGEHKRTNFKVIRISEVEESFEIILRNRKTEPVIVTIVEHAWDDWQVTANSHKFVKKDAHAMEFPVTVAPNEEVKVTYTIRTKWAP